MPHGNQSAPFVMAVVGELEKGSLFNGGAALPPSIVQSALESGAIFGAVLVVIPSGDFGLLHVSKMRAVSKLAELQRDITGLNAAYVSKRGLNPRDFLYGRLATIAVSGAAFNAHACGLEYSAVDAVFDQKDMSQGLRRLIADRMMDDARIRNQVLASCSEPAPSRLHELALKRYARIYQIRPRWEPGRFGDSSFVGLRCADRVAYLVASQCLGAMQAGESLVPMFNWPNVSVADAKDYVLAPLEDSSLLAWEERTKMSCQQVVPAHFRQQVASRQ